MQRPAATVVLVAWNSWASTAACLASLRPTLRTDDQVVVVDNGSTDETPMFLPDHDWIDIVSNPRNRGLAAAYNQGAAVATRARIVFMHNDTLVTPGWLENLLAPLADPRIGAVGPRCNPRSGPQVLLDPSDTQPVQDPNYSPGSMANLDNYSRRWHWDHLGERRRTDRLGGWCLAIRKEAFDEVGGFDETFGRKAGEDIDLSIRLDRAGWPLLIADDVFVHHFGRVTLAANNVNWRAVQREGARLLGKKHPELVNRWRTDAEDASAALASEPVAADERQALPVLAGELFCRGPIAGVPQVSIVLPTYNRLGSLQAALRSVAQQTALRDGVGLEVVVVNDAGADVRPVLSEFDGLLDIQLVDREVNAGPSAARNAGIRRARGSLLGFLDDDDVLFPHHVAACLEALRRGGPKTRRAKRPVAARAYCIRVTEDAERGTVRRTVAGDAPFDAQRLSVLNNTPLVSVLFPTEAVREAGGFDEGMTVLEDWELLLNLVRRGLRVIDVPVPTAEYRVHESNHAMRYARRLHQGLMHVYSRHPATPNSPAAKARVTQTAASALEVHVTSVDVSVVVAASADPDESVVTLQSAAQALQGARWELVLIVPDHTSHQKLIEQLDGELQYFVLEAGVEEAFAFGAARAGGKSVLLLRAGEIADSELVVRGLFDKEERPVRVGKTHARADLVPGPRMPFAPATVS